MPNISFEKGRNRPSFYTDLESIKSTLSWEEKRRYRKKMNIDLAQMSNFFSYCVNAKQ